MESKSITFVLAGTASAPIGGHKVIYEYANRLSARGHKVTLCYLSNGSFLRYPIPESFRRILRRILVRHRPTWFNLSGSVIKKYVRSISDRDIPDGDCVFATEVCTAVPVAELSPSKGSKFYLIQGYENWSLPSDAVDETYRLGMTNIVISRWLEELVNSKTDSDCARIPNAIDSSVFYPDTNNKRDKYAIAVMFSPEANKGFDYAWESILKVRHGVTNLRVNMFGSYPPPPGLPEWVSYTRNASQAQLRSIYSGSAVYVCASVMDGFGLTCVEAMACGCALVVSDFCGSREYAINGWNALVSPVRDSNAMSVSIERLIMADGEREQIAVHGIETARLVTWEESVKKLEMVLNQS